LAAGNAAAAAGSAGSQHQQQSSPPPYRVHGSAARRSALPVPPGPLPERY
jgi:hypothetical protein